MLWWNLLLGLVLIPAAATVALRLRLPGRYPTPLNAGHGAQCLAVAALYGLAQVLPVAVLLELAARSCTVRAAANCW